jgi:hypothetical protein
MRNSLLSLLIASFVTSLAAGQLREHDGEFGQKRVADQFDWKQNPNSPQSLVAGSNTVRLSPCPRGFLGGMNGSNANHWIYVDSAKDDTQQPGEPVLIIAEECPAGSASGTVTFQSAYPHRPGYGLESGTGGIREALVEASQVRLDRVRGNNIWIEVTPRPTTSIKAPLFWQTSMGRLVGMSLLECSVNTSCINIGDTNSGGFARGDPNKYVNNVMDGFWIRPDPAMKFWNVAPARPATITASSTSATLTLTTCPAGFWPLIPNQILWLNGTSEGLVSTPYEPGAPGPGEFVRVTGGSCIPGAAEGTITIAPATPGIASLFAHGKGYTLSNGATAFIEDNSQGTVIENITTNGFVGNIGYGSVIQNDNDQANEVLNVNVNGGIRCDSDFCGATLFGPGPNHINAGITNMMFGSSGQCAEWYNGNDFYMGPTVCQGFNNFGLFLSVKRGGSLQRALIHAVHRERGGMSNALAKNLGAADMVIQGYAVEVDGNGQSTTSFPNFPVEGEPGGKLQLYYLSIMNVTDGTKTVPIPLGQAQVDNPSANHVTVKWVTADALAGKTVQFELYRLTPTYGSAGQVPYPGLCDGAGSDGTCLVATSINPAEVCDIHGVCVFTDDVATQQAATPYTGIDGSGNGGYFPFIGFSPGGVVLSAGATYHGEPTCVVTTAAWLSNNVSSFNNSIPPSRCQPAGGSFNITMNSLSSGTLTYPQLGLLLPDRNRTSDGGRFTGLKGRINLIGGGTYPRDLFTWVDSNPAKTMSSKLEYGNGVVGTTYGTINRPQWDLGDIATGVENGGKGFYNRVPSGGVFDWYVGALPNNPGGVSSNWTEELSSAQHLFNVPVSLRGSSGLSVGGVISATGGVQVGTSGTPLSQLTLYETGNVAPAAVPANSCLDQPFAVKGLLSNDRITQVTPPSPLPNVSLNGYPAAAGGSIILHFCNPTNGAVRPPGGSYSFLAVH